MSLASLKAKLKVGTLLKLVRHDFLKLTVIYGNLGVTTLQPKLFIGQVRPIVRTQTNAIVLRSEQADSWLNFPKAKYVRETPNGFEIDLNVDGPGDFKEVMAYEFVSTHITREHEDQLPHSDACNVCMQKSRCMLDTPHQCGATPVPCGGEL